MAETDLPVNQGICSWIWGWFNWTSTSPTMLRSIEKKIFSYMKTAYRGFYVDIGPAVGNSDKIWTVSLNSENSSTPLVLLHGLGAGVALWVMNLDYLAENRPVYAIDLLGFGRSSRPKFSNNALIAEKQFVKSIEEWRREMNLGQMILLGHSMGGFLATSYAISYPDRVKHLILADPWGFVEKPADALNKPSISWWVKAIATVVSPLNPFWALRAAGPFGQWVVEKTRPDIMKKFTTAVKEETLIPKYIHQCNAQTPSGESAFHAMMETFGWAKYPMMKRMSELRSDVPITLLYGSRSWIDTHTTIGEKIKALRQDGRVNIEVISGAGHHVYADKPQIFNKYVVDACKNSENESNEQNVTLNREHSGEGTESDQENDPILNRDVRR